MGFILNLLPLLIAIIVLFLINKFSFLNCFLLLIIVNTVNESLKLQTKAGIYYSTTPATRTVIESKILDGTASFKERFIYFVITFWGIIIFGWTHTVSILIYSGIATFVFHFFRG